MSPTTTWKSWIWSTFTVAPGQHQGALSHLRGFPLAPRPSQWGSRVRRLILLLWNACSQAPAFLVLNLPSSGVCVSAPGSEHRAWNCISWARPPILFSKTSLLLSMAAAWKAALFWHDLHHPSSRLRTSCCSEGCFLSSLHLPSEAKHGRFFFVCLFLLWTIFEVYWMYYNTVSILVFFVFVFFLNLGHKVYEILAPWLGIEPRPPALEGKVLTTGTPGKACGGSYDKELKLLLCPLCPERWIQIHWLLISISSTLGPLGRVLEISGLRKISILLSETSACSL